MQASRNFIGEAVIQCEREVSEVITSRRPVTDNSSLDRPVLLPASEFPEKKEKRIRHDERTLLIIGTHR